MQDFYIGIEKIVNLIYDPISYIINNFGIADKIIKIGIGNVEWFSFTLNEILFLISTILIYIFIYKIIIGFFKKLINLFKGWY